MAATVSTVRFVAVQSCYNGPRYNGNLVIPDALTSQSHLAIAGKLKFGRLAITETLFYTPVIARADCITPN